MALTRKYLKEIGIEPEKIDLIIEAHTDTVDALKDDRDKYKESADKVKGLEKELEEAKANAQTDSEWKEKYEKEHSDFETYKKEQAEKETQESIRSAYKKLLKEAGVSEKRIDSVLKVTDLSEIKLDKDGNLENSDKLTESIKKDWSDFITSTDTKGAQTITQPNNNTKAGMTKEEILAIKDSATRQKAIAENHTLFGI